MKKTARAFAPAAISSFFEICDTTSDGKRILDLERVGARGGGFGLQKGVLTEVTISTAEINHISVCINGKAAPEALTTRAVIETLLYKAKGAYNVSVDHKIEVPVGAGFGTSAGGALTTGLALAEVLKLPLTHNQIGKIAHVADIQCQTGLGTVTSLTVGGSCMLVLEPGAPGVGVVDRIPLNPNYVVVVGVIKAALTKSMLFPFNLRAEINFWGKKTLQAILEEPSIENFLACCWQFAQKTGFATPKVKQLVNSAQKAGAVGAAQNMIGEVVHALVRKEKAVDVAEAFKRVLSTENVLLSKLDFEGARLVS